MVGFIFGGSLEEFAGSLVGSYVGGIIDPGIDPNSDNPHAPSKFDPSLPNPPNMPSLPNEPDQPNFCKADDGPKFRSGKSVELMTERFFTLWHFS